MPALPLLLLVSLAGSDEEPAKPPPEHAGAPIQTVVVTGSRMPRPLRDEPGTVTVIPREEVDRSPTSTLDALVRTVPSVATFRRSSSLVADPSSQGLNLRGVGPSGVSRALLWVDGVPANDPFGGWIYWQAVPRLGVERIEVAPGGSSSLYGSSALGGMVQLFSRRIEGAAIEGDLLGGSFASGSLAARAAGRSGGLGFSVEGELWTTGGHPVVAPHERGAIDGNAWSRHATALASAEYALTPGLRLRATGGYFAEEQNGGTAFTTAGVRQWHGAAAAEWTPSPAALVHLVAFGKLQTFEQTRTRPGPDRSTEARAGDQHVPADEQGLSAVLRHEGLGRHTASFGVELRRVFGVTEEELYPPVVSETSPVFRRAGGEQLFAGAFGQDVYAVSDELELVAGLRLDAWRNEGGFREVTVGSGEEGTEAFAPRSELQLSPRLGVRFRPVDAVTLRASAYRAFRAPTLNELYRPFQVGTVLTAANAELRAETLLGAELGVELLPHPALALRATGFWNELIDPVTNATLETPLPDGAQRQRQNLGRARSPGVELGGELRIARHWSAVVAYAFIDARVTEAEREELIGKLLPQDPRHRGTALLAFDDRRLLTATVQLRVNGPQFEDDLNELPLGGYAVVDASLSVPVWRGLEVFAAVENLFDREYLVGRAGVDTVGQPRFVRGGLRLREDRTRW